MTIRTFKDLFPDEGDKEPTATLKEYVLELLGIQRELLRHIEALERKTQRMEVKAHDAK